MSIIAASGQADLRERIHAHVDYATIIFPIASMQDVNDIMAFLVKESDEWCSLNEQVCVANYKFYENKIKSVKHLQGGYSLPGEGGYVQNGELMLQISGKYWEECSVYDQWRLLIGIKNAYNGRFTRCDLAIDDLYNNVIPVEEMRQARINKNVKHFRNWKTIISGSIDGKEQRTDYYGSRESEKLVRVYKHDNEFYRFEGEFRGSRAQSVVDIICELKRVSYENQTSEEFDCLLQQVIASIVVGTIDFVDRWKDNKYMDDAAKCNRLEFYQKFIDKIGGCVRVSSVKRERSLTRTMTWINRQAILTLAAIHRGLKAEKWMEWFSDIISGAEKRETPYHRMIEAAIRNNPREAWSYS